VLEKRRVVGEEHPTNMLGDLQLDEEVKCDTCRHLYNEHRALEDWISGLDDLKNWFARNWCLLRRKVQELKTS
jgi:hypothetical protein